MAGYIDDDGNYYEGDPLPGAKEVPLRPAAFCTWDGLKWNEDTVGAKEHATQVVETSVASALLRCTGADSSQFLTFLKLMDANQFRAANYQGIVPAMVQAESDAAGTDPKSATDSILATHETLVTKAAKIETIRRKAQISLDAAVTIPDIEAIRNSAVQQLSAI